MRVRSWCSLMAAAVFAGVLACSEVSFPVQPAEEFTATLSGANELPAVTTTATGTAVFAVVLDTILSYRVDVAGIDSTTVARVYAGAAGVSGGDTILTVFTGPSACRDASGNRINLSSPRCRAGYTGPLAPAQVKASQLTRIPLSYGATARARFDSLLVLMRTGGAYVNVHTRANGAGEIRGQIQRQ